MIGVGETVGAAEAVAVLCDGVDLLLDSDLTLLCREELLELTRALERQTRRLAAVDHQLVAELENRNVAGDLACRDTATVLHQLLNVSPGEAKARVQAARDLGPRHGLTGEHLSPVFGAVAAAVREGTLSAGHVRVITATIEALPAELDASFGTELQACLVEHAAHLDPTALNRAARRLLARLDQDGVEPNDETQQRRRCLSLHHNRDGSATIAGRLTAAAAAVWEAVLDSLSAPQPADSGVPAADEGVAGGGGEPDPRTPGQRHHDGFLDAGLRLLRSGSLPDCGGAPVTVLATVTADQLRERTGYADTAHGELISVAELLQLAAEADIVPVVLNEAGGVLSYGRTRRLASPAQRHALAARDRGCSFPGCTRPPSWCQAHHITAWADGGLTEIDQLTLLCGYHHREFEKRGWRCQMLTGGAPARAGVAGGGGTPHWIPPSWIDPAQIPRRNTAHHVEITFAHAS